MAVNSHNPRLAFVYVAMMLLAVLTSSGRIGGGDGRAMLNVTRSMAYHASLEASPCQAAPKSNHCVAGVDGRLYAGFGLLPSALAVVPMIAGEGLAKLAHKDSDLLSAFLVCISNVFVGTLIPIVLVLWLVRMGFSWIPSLVTALLLFFGTVLWHHSVKGFYSEPLFTLGMLAAPYLACIAQRRTGFLAAGFVFGCSIACRVFGLIFAPVFALYCFSLPNSGGLNNRLSRAVLFGLGALPPLALIAWSNYIRFGDVTKTGYHLAYPTASALLSNPPIEGLRGILFNGEVGLVWFTPWIILVPLAVYQFWKVRPLEALLTATILIESCLFFACYVSWHGGWAYGPRLLLPSLPFAALPMVMFFEQWRARAPATKVMVAVLVGASVFIQLSGITYPPARYYEVGTFCRVHHEPTPWHGSIVIAQWEEFPEIVQRSIRSAPPSVIRSQETAEAEATSDESIAAASRSASEFLASFPNAINLTCADVWLLKATRLGLPAPIAAAISLTLLISSVRLFRGALREPQ